MTVIAMTREMGSLGKDVAKGVADRLGLDLVYHEIVKHIADHMHLTPSAVVHYLDGTAGLLNRLRVDRRKLALFTAEEIFEVARHGNVLIRGWGATALLAPVSHVVRVRVRAPMELRIQRMVERIDPWNADAAREEIRRSDAAHDRVLRELCGVADWENPRHYHRVFDTGQQSVEECIEALIALAQQPQFQPTPESEAKLAQLAEGMHVKAAELSEMSAVAHSHEGL